MVLAILAVSLFILSIFLYLRGNGLGILLFTIVLVYIIRHFIVRNIFLPETSLRAYSQQKALHTPQRIVFLDEGVSITSKYGHANLPWTLIRKWRENEQYLLIYQTDDQFLILPKRDMVDNDKHKNLINLLKQKQIPGT